MPLFHRVPRAVRGLASGRRVFEQRPDPDALDRAEAEGTIAHARVASVALAALLAAPDISTRPPTAPAFALYLAWAVLLVLHLRPEGAITSRLRVVVQVVDTVVPATLAWMVPTLSGVMAGLAVLPVAAAAIRWGATPAALFALPLAAIVWSRPVEAAAALPVALMAVVFAASAGSRRRRHGAVIRQIRDRSESASNFRGAVAAALGALRELFEASGARLVLRERRSRRTFVWQLETGATGGPDAKCIERLRGDDCGGDDPSRPRVRLAIANWDGTLELVDPAWRIRLADNRYLLQRIAAELIPVLYPAYRAAHADARAASRERARLARELHDGLVQSLIGADMHIESLRRRAQGLHAPIGSELQYVQRILRQETLSVRELMARLKPLDITHAELPRFVSELVDRFRYDSGIRVELSTDGAPALRSRRDCIDLARILQEALSNVRKHSGATWVSLDIRWTEPALSLVVQDNGCGFPFEGTARYAGGRLDLADCHHQDEPQLRPLVPSAIVECVRSLNGQLLVVSSSTKGARLEIAVPARAVFERAGEHDRIAS